MWKFIDCIRKQVTRIAHFLWNFGGEIVDNRYLFKAKTNNGKWIEWNILTGIPHVQIL